MKKICFFMAIILALASCDYEKKPQENERYTTYEVNPDPEFMTKVDIPTGYKLVDIAHVGYLILYLQNEKGDIYKFEDGKIICRIIIPDGFKLVAALPYGKYSQYTLLYLENSKGEIFFKKL